MSQNDPYNPDPNVPPSGVPDPNVYNPNAQPVDTAKPVNPIDDFRETRGAESYRPAEPAYQKPEVFTRGHDRAGGAWIWGLFLIALGVVFLLENTGLFNLENWWALFIMLPAIGSFRAAYAAYQSAGNRLTGGVRGPLMGGVILTTIAMIFLFGLDFGAMWPLLLVIAGAALLVNALLPG